MSTYRNVWVATRFASIDNAKKSNKTASFRTNNDIVYIHVGGSTLVGKLKAFVEEHMTDHDDHGANYNGYGWADHYYNYYLTAKDGKEFQAMLEGKKAEKKAPKTWEQIRDAWARQLVRRSDGAVTFEEAQQMAEEKQEYKDDRINDMKLRDSRRGYSYKRNVLIRKMERENPLRPIKDYDHAMSIIAASNRHRNTDYENLLEEAHDLERIGEIEKGTAKDWARQQINS